MKFDLSDWHGRKARLLPVLDDAARAGLVPSDGTATLAEFLLGRGVGVGFVPDTNDPGATGLDAPRASEPALPVEESEAPRFIRGFHDILITIGIIVALVGVAGLASVYAVIPVALVLAEILVRRQRLALPAVTLTAAVIMAVGYGTVPIWEAIDKAYEHWFPAGTLAAIGVASLLVYWRYKVPIALAGGLVSAFAAIVYALGFAVWWLSGNPTFFDAHPTVLVGFLGLFAVLVFGTALWFDIRDRHRLTRRSDVAFWMHLAAAPAILYTIMAQIYLGSTDVWFAANTTAWQAAAVVGAVLLLMLIGIILDRRAFVTSGLLSFGYAFRILMTEGGLADALSSADTLIFLTFLAIGVVVLSLGIGWQPLRNIIVRRLPDGLQDMIPPVKG